MAKTKQSAQNKPAGTSLARRQPPPRSEKALKRSERTAATTDMRRPQALFPSIYADAQEKLQAARFGAVASKATADAPARATTEVLPPLEIRTATQILIFDTFIRMGLVPHSWISSSRSCASTS